MTASRNQRLSRRMLPAERPPRTVLAAAMLAAGTLAVAGCGGGATANPYSRSPSTTGTGTTATTPPPVNGAAVGASSVAGRTVLVDASGRTLYVLVPETSTHLLCASETCLSAWPPATVASRAKLHAAVPGLAAHLGVLQRSDGKLQITVDNRPLYTYAGDGNPGEANGQEIRSFGGTWLVVGSSGAAVHG